jgi:hypothetical protein
MPAPKTRSEEYDCSVAGQRVETTVAVFEFPSKHGPMAQTKRPISCAGVSICGLFKTSELPQGAVGSGCPLIELLKRDPIWK